MVSFLNISGLVDTYPTRFCCISHNLFSDVSVYDGLPLEDVGVGVVVEVGVGVATGELPTVVGCTGVVAGVGKVTQLATQLFVFVGCTAVGVSQAANAVALAHSETIFL